MTRLITILLVGFLSFSCMAFQETWKPGEGQVRLNTKSQLRFDAGNYEVFVLMDVTMKYRFTTLLGDHVELFIPKYDVEQVKVYKKGSNNEIFTAFLRGSWNGQRIEKINEGDSPNFHVSPEIMSNFQMMSLDFRLQKSSEHLIDRRFPGYLRGAGLWGWDVPGSKRWEDVFSFYKVNAVKAKEVWLNMTKEPEPIIYGDLLDATFSVYGLMAAITRQIPNAFKSSKDVSPAFAQMASLKGQLVQAEDSRAPDLARRRELTDKAWRLLKDEMSTEEREAIDRITPYGFDDSITEDLENLFTLVEKDYADDEKLTKANQDRLNRALSTYTPTKLKELSLPSKVYTELSRLASGGVNWKELVVKRGNNGKYGYQNKGGRWIIQPQFRESYPFNAGYGIVDIGGDEFVIDIKGEKLSKSFGSINYYSEDNRKVISSLGTFCANERGTGTGIYDMINKRWILKPGKNRCEFEKTTHGEYFDLEGPETGGLKTMIPERKRVRIYDAKGTVLLDKTATGVGVYGAEYESAYFYYWSHTNYGCSSGAKLTYTTDYVYLDENLNIVREEKGRKSSFRNHWACK